MMSELEKQEIEATINILGEQFLKLLCLARKCSVSDFIQQALSVLQENIQHDAAWWGLVYEQGIHTKPVFYQVEMVGLPECFSREWIALSLQDDFAKDVAMTIGQVQRYSYEGDYEDKSESAELIAFSRKYQLKQGMAILLDEPFTGHRFFIVLYRQSEQTFSDIEARLFYQLIQHTVQLWRYNLQDTLLLSTSDQMQNIAYVRKDGRIVSIGMKICEAIYSQWPIWDGISLPVEIVNHFTILPNRMRLNRGILMIRERAEHLYLEYSSEDHLVDLPSSEYQVAQLFAAGNSYKQIAKLVGLTPATVRTYLQRAYSRLGVNNKIQLGKVLSMYLVE